MTELRKVGVGHETFSGTTPDYESRLEVWDPKKNANKFWHVFAYGPFVVRHWGRHGSKGQWSVHRAWSEWEAKNAAIELAGKKRRKGYKKEVGVLDRFTREVG